MKIPETPPDLNKIIEDVLKNDQDIGWRLFTDFKPTDEKGRYFHWENLKHRKPPHGFKSEEWWVGIKLSRRNLYKKTAFLDKFEKPFRFAIPDCVLKDLLWLNQSAAGSISRDKSITSSEMRNTYLISSLIREAINSSQMEGASTTYRVAKEMLLKRRPPKNNSEQMISNNYRAMEQIRDLKNQPLTESMILELHKILTEKTLENPEDAGRFRKTDDIEVVDPRDGQLLHIPPKASQIPERIKRLCKFANEDDPNIFIPPAIKSIILHFMLAYDHPFADGNGRTARALFYWSMLRNDCWMMQYISISQILKVEYGKYAKAFLHTETDDNDLTYFIIHQLSVIRKAIDALHSSLKKKVEKIVSTREILEGVNRFKGRLNFRQISLLKHAIENPNAIYTVKEHQNTHGTAYETARKDLMIMADELNLLVKQKAGRAFIFISPEDLKTRIEKEK